MYQQDSALNNLQCLICHETQSTRFFIVFTYSFEKYSPQVVCIYKQIFYLIIPSLFRPAI